MDLSAERLVETYADTILRVCYTYLHSVADAEDICQDTLLKLMNCTEPFGSAEHERAWVIRVAINACKDVLRRNSEHEIVPLDAVPEPIQPERADEAARQVQTQYVLDAVMSLPVLYREVIYLRYYENYSIRAIARVLGVSEDVVSQRLSRARKQLKPKLAGADLGEGELDD